MFWANDTNKSSLQLKRESATLSGALRSNDRFGLSVDIIVPQFTTVYYNVPQFMARDAQ